MTDREKLLALAERVENATVNDVCLAKAIFKEVYPDKVPHSIVTAGYGWREDSAGWWLQTGEDERVPRRTITPPQWLTSLDAAMTLVPEGWFIYGVGERVKPIFYKGDRHDRIDFWAEVQRRQGGLLQKSFVFTPALALTAAALRAAAGGV